MGHKNCQFYQELELLVGWTVVDGIHKKKSQNGRAIAHIFYYLSSNIKLNQNHLFLFTVKLQQSSHFYHDFNGWTPIRTGFLAPHTRVRRHLRG
jgi:hypothetical protein